MREISKAPEPEISIRSRRKELLPPFLFDSPHIPLLNRCHHKFSSATILQTDAPEYSEFSP
jgi:hypothetical protein